MSGKILLKRKHDKEGENSASNECTSSNSISKRKCSLDSQAELKPRNELLIEALQRIVELQSELDDFERDLDEHNQIDPIKIETTSTDDASEEEHHATHDAEFKHTEAEAIGFAMCARETLLFLQREGFSPDSVLYKSLHQQLSSKSDGLIPI